jgi:hypothetical protein
MQSTPEPHDRPRRFCLVFARGGGGGQLQTIPLTPAFARSTYGFAARDRADLLPSVSVERLRRRSFGQQVEASNVAKPQTGHTRANLSRASALVWPRLRGHACARATLAALKAGRAQVEEKLRELGRVAQPSSPERLKEQLSLFVARRGGFGQTGRVASHGRNVRRCHVPTDTSLAATKPPSLLVFRSPIGVREGLIDGVRLPRFGLSRTFSAE